MKSVVAIELGARIGKYRILRELGRGSMGVVYLAEDAKLRREVALKILNGALSGDADFRRRFELEARSVAALSHPHIVRVHAFDPLDDLLAIEMELVEGGSLADVMETKGLTVSELARLAYQALDALACCHDDGLVHRDIKPTNILVDRYGNAKLTDFGLAKILEGHLEESICSSGSSVFFMGTPRYAPPEAWDAVEATPAWDLYSLGMVMYQAVAGSTPYLATTPMALVKEMATRHVAPLGEAAPHVSPEFAALVDSMIDHNPNRRPESARAAIEQLRGSAEMDATLDARAPTIVSRRDPARSYLGTFVKKTRWFRPRAYHGFIAGAVVAVALSAWLFPRGEAPIHPAPAKPTVPSSGEEAVETQEARFWESIPGTDDLPLLIKDDSVSSQVYDIWFQEEDVTHAGALLSFTEGDNIHAFAAYEGSLWSLNLSPNADTWDVAGSWAAYEGTSGSVLRMGAIRGQARRLPSKVSALLLSLEFTNDQTNSRTRRSVSLTEAALPHTDTRFLLGFEAMPIQLPLLYNELIPRRAEWAMQLDALLPAIAGARTKVPPTGTTGRPIVVDGVLNEETWTRSVKDKSGKIGVLRGMPGQRGARMLVRKGDEGLYLGVEVPVENSAPREVGITICRRFSLPESTTRWWRMFYTKRDGVNADMLIGRSIQPWSCAWQAAAQESQDTWACEVYIPYEDLGNGAAPSAGERWRVNCGVNGIENPAHPTPLAVWGYPDLEDLRHGLVLEF